MFREINVTSGQDHGWARDGETQREEVAGATFDEVRMVWDLTD
jgi:hypothetical protein